MAVDWRNPLDGLDASGDGAISPLDALLIINDINARGSRALPLVHPPSTPYVDTSGDQFLSPQDALLVINYINSEGAGPRTLREGPLLADEKSLTITVGQDAGSRSYRVQLDASFDTSSNGAALEDVLAVYLVDADNPSQTLLDRGTPGTTIFTLAGTRAEFSPGVVNWDGSVLTINTTSLASRDTALLKFQLISSDTDTGSRVVITPLSNDVDPDGGASVTFPANDAPVTAGGTATLAALAATLNVDVQVENVRFDASTGRYSAELRLHNVGTAIGREVVVVFPGLPAGVTLRHPSGTTAGGAPYLNVRPAIPRGGLGSGSRSDAVKVEFDDPSQLKFALTPQVLAGTNHAPSFDTIGPFTTSPGSVLIVPLVATDPDGDAVTFTLRGATNLPTGSLDADGTLTFRPTPAQLGTYQFDVIARDGVLEATRSVSLNVVADTITNTRVSGRVLQVNGQPLANMQVEIGAVQGLTGPDGSFMLDLGSGPIISDTLKVRGELFGGSLVYPFIAEKLPLVLEHEVYPQVNNVIDRAIYLPAIDTANGKVIDPARDTTVTTAAIPGVSVFVKAGTLMNQQGTPFTGMLTITEVPIGLTPAALPTNLLPDLVVTIQPGEMVFATPAPMTFPNRSGWAPGTLMDLWSISPVTGEFQDVGDMRVSADGTTVETISGGVRNSSWHLICPRLLGGRNASPDHQCDECAARVTTNSQAELQTGALLESHTLTPYLSQGVSRSLTLVYDSERAQPRTVVSASFQIEEDTSQQGLGTSGIAVFSSKVTLKQGSFALAVPGDTGGSFGLKGGDQFSSLDGITVVDVGKRILSSRVVDMSDAPSGAYDVEFLGGVYRVSGGSLAGSSTPVTGRVTSVNGRESPYGVGWGIAELKELVPLSDGGMMLVEGDGSEVLFGPPSGTGMPFANPPGHFSRLERNADGTFQHTMPDQTVSIFGQSGKLLSTRDRNGQQTRFSYDVSGRLISVIDPVAQQTTLSYTGGRLSLISDPAGRQTQFTHDTSGNLISVRDPDGALRTWTYDARNLMVAERDALGRDESSEFDQFGSLTATTRKDGSRLTIRPAISASLQSGSNLSEAATLPRVAFETGVAHFIDGNGVVTLYDLDQAGQTVSTRDNQGEMGKVTRDSLNRVTSYRDARGYSTDFKYDAQGNPISTSTAIQTPVRGGDGDIRTSEMFPGAEYAIGSTGTSTLSSIVADVNGDGRPDLLSTMTDGQGSPFPMNFVKIQRARATGGFEAAEIVTAATRVPNHVAVADFNEDGISDLLTGHSYLQNLKVKLGNQLGGYTTATTPSLSSFVDYVLASDFNNDGHQDIVAISNDANKVFVSLGDGAGAFGPLSQFAVPGDPVAAVAGDFNGDTHVDILTANSSGNSVTVLTGDGLGGFVSGAALAVGTQPRYVVLSDVNGDGHPDIITANRVSDNITVLLGDGTGQILSSTHFPAGDGPVWLAIGDVSASGKVDIVVADEAGKTASVLFGNGAGEFALAESIVVSSNASTVSLADMTGDGVSDLVVGMHNVSQAVIFVGLVGGGFQSAPLENLGATAPALTIGDLNNDLQPDLVVAFGNARQVAVNLGDGTGGFSAPQITASIGAPFAITIGDVAGDAYLDVITAEVSSDTITVFMGDGTGGLFAPQQHSVGDGPIALVASDLNGDLRSDVITANQNSDSISILYRSDTGFETPVQLSVGDLPRALAVGDINHDGRPDIVSANFGTNNVSILLATPTGGFEPSVSRATGTGPTGVQLADVNGDSHLDIVTVNRTSDNVSVLLGDGFGGFAIATHFGVGNGPEAIVAADFDRDGSVDLATVDNLDASLTVLLNNSAGAFGEPLRFMTFRAISMATGDLNFDGAADLVVGGSGPLAYILKNQVTSPPAAVVTSNFEYDATFSQLRRHVDELGRITTYDIDPSNGNTLALHRPGGQDVTFTYTASGQIDTVTDPLGRVTDFDYDQLGRKLKVTIALGTPDEGVTRYEYDAAGNTSAVVNENGGRTEYEYDAHNRVTLVRDVLGKTTQYQYDLRGNVVRATDAQDNVTKYAYDARDRLVSTTDAQNQVTRFAYNNEGNLKSVTDPLGHVTQHRYDARNRRVETIDAHGGRTRFQYDLDGNLVSLTDPVGNRTLFDYDSRNRLVREIDPLGKVIRYVYDAADNLIRKTDRNGRVTRYEYDSLNRLKEETWVGDTSSGSGTPNVIEYTYDLSDNLTSVHDNFSSLAYAYDARDRVVLVDNAGTPLAPNVVLTYGYDVVSNVTSVADTINGQPGAVTSYTYDTLDRLSTLTQGGSGLSDKRVDFAYNALGQYDHIRRYSDLAATSLVIDTQYAYDNLNRLASIDHRNSAGDAVAFFHYAYDSASRISQITDIDGATNYGYDDRDQLTSALHADPTNPDESYTYDENGNRLGSHLHGTSYVTGSGNRLLSDGTYNYEYDAEGNTIRRTEIATGQVREFQWDYRNRLTAVIDKGANGTKTQEVRFIYDALDRRIAKSVDTNPADAIDAVFTHFVYDREDVILDFADTDGAGLAAPVMTERYLQGAAIDQVLAQEGSSGQAIWQLADLLGTVHSLVDGNGLTIKHLTYDSFGNVKSETNTAVQSRYLFSGREYDDEIDLYYLRARYLSPKVGQFVSKDAFKSLSAVQFPYVYSSNSPIMFVDLSGLTPINFIQPNTNAIGAHTGIKWVDLPSGQSWPSPEDGYTTFEPTDRVPGQRFVPTKRFNPKSTHGGGETSPRIYEPPRGKGLSAPPNRARPALPEEIPSQRDVPNGMRGQAPRLLCPLMLLYDALMFQSRYEEFLRQQEYEYFIRYGA